MWRGTLLPGSFRGVSFQIDSHSFSGGRRGELHEYPQRDTPYFEDLGRKTREFTIDAFIVGDTYNATRDALISACEAAGAGTLVHPYLGTKQVVCQTFTVSERIDEGRMCRVSMVLTEAGANLFPSGGTDIAFQVAGLSSLANTSNLADFVSSYRSAGLPGFVFDSVKSVTENFATLIGGLSSDVDFLEDLATFGRDLSTLTRAPAEFGQRVIDLITGLRTSISPRTRNSATAKASVTAMKGLTSFSANAQSSRINQTTPARVAEVGNMQAVAALVRRAALANESVSIPSLKLDSYQDAISYAQDYVARVDTELLTSGVRSDAYLPMTNLASVVSTALSAQAVALPLLTQTTIGETVPTLALSYELYADPTKADDIAARNKIRHPSFVPSNVALEVLAR